MPESLYLVDGPIVDGVFWPKIIPMPPTTSMSSTTDSNQPETSPHYRVSHDTSTVKAKKNMDSNDISGPDSVASGHAPSDPLLAYFIQQSQSRWISPEQKLVYDNLIKLAGYTDRMEEATRGER